MNEIGNSHEIFAKKYDGTEYNLFDFSLRYNLFSSETKL